MLLGPIDGMLGPAVGVEAARERGQVPLLAGLWDTRTKVQAIAELRPGTIAGAASHIVHRRRWRASSASISPPVGSAR